MIGNWEEEPNLSDLISDDEAKCIFTGMLNRIKVNIINNHRLYKFEF